MKQLIHWFLFHISWGACIFGALNQAVWLSFSVSVTCLTLTILLSSPKRRTDIFKVCIIMVLGVLLEIANAALPLYNFVPDTGYPPAWLLCFWPAFAIMFLESLKFFYNKNILIRFVAGFIGGAGYWAGEWMGLMKFLENTHVTMGLFATLWAIEFIALLKVSAYIDKRFS
ncbi:MAG: DUF2878 domain-containing protein [Bdellovibrionaceae bacterium]|nr:DUF2878 domain-containing protein [Pseudobdellovibrionaceae bacterium]